jgi:hypothetical protein
MCILYNYLLLYANTKKILYDYEYDILIEELE